MTLATALRLDRPWSILSVLLRLADAADHLLDDHDCDAHGYEEIRAAADAARDILIDLPAALAATSPVAFPRAAWHDDDGECLWWKLPVTEPPYVGSPLDDDFPDYVTHWTRLPEPPVEPTSPQPTPCRPGCPSCPARCTGLTARWCPIHGNCSCPGEYLDSEACPLHAPSSAHAEAHRG